MDSELLNLLVLPLLGGYVFYTKFHGTSFAANRAEGQRLIYSSAVVGVLLLLVARGTEKLVLLLIADSHIRVTAQSAALVCVLAGCLTATFFITMFCGRHDLKEVAGALPGAATVSAFSLAGSGAILYYFNYGFAVRPLAMEILPALLLLFTSIVLAAKWVIATSRLHYSTVVARLALLWLALSTGLMLVLIYGPWVAQQWPKFSNIDYSGIALLAAGIGAIAWIPLNVVLTEKWAWHRAHRAGRTSGLEHLLFKAFLRAAWVQMTLKDGKVYVGYLLDMPAPRARIDGACIEFVPVKSGYREQPGKHVVMTTNYARVLAKMAKLAKKTKRPGDALASRLATVTKVVPISEVLCVGMYNEKLKDSDFALPAPRRRRVSEVADASRGKTVSHPTQAESTPGR